MHDLNSAKIKAVMEFVLENLSSSFYVDLYNKRHFDHEKVKTFSDFRQIPFLTKKDIDKVSSLDRLFTLEEKVGCWVRTSGTTSGKPLLFPMSKVKLEHLDVLAQALKKKDIRKILLLKPLGFITMRVYEWNNHPKLSSYPLILGDIGNLDLTAKIAKELEIDGIETTPSALYYLMPFLKEAYSLDRIHFIRLSGEFTSEEKLKFFKNYFKNADFDFDLGAMEAGGNTAFRCEHLNSNYSPRFYHPKKNLLFEVINEKGKSLPLGEVGELVLTSLFRTPFPLVRYKTGDMVKLSKINCPCGRKLLLEIFGRVGYDSVRIGGITIYRHLLEEALAKAFGGKLKGDYEMHLYEKVYKKRFIPSLTLKLTEKIKDPKTFGSRVAKNLKVGSNISLDSLIKQEAFAPLNIEKVDKFGQDYKKLKIISHLK